MLRILTTCCMDFCWSVRAFITKNGFHIGWRKLVEEDNPIALIKSEIGDDDLFEIQKDFYAYHKILVNATSTRCDLSGIPLLYFSSQMLWKMFSGESGGEIQFSGDETQPAGKEKPAGKGNKRKFINSSGIRLLYFSSQMLWKMFSDESENGNRNENENESESGSDVADRIKGSFMDHVIDLLEDDLDEEDRIEETLGTREVNATAYAKVSSLHPSAEVANSDVTLADCISYPIVTVQQVDGALSAIKSCPAELPEGRVYVFRRWMFPRSKHSFVMAWKPKK